jgi:hypothetical protein
MEVEMAQRTLADLHREEAEPKGVLADRKYKVMEQLQLHFTW